MGEKALYIGAVASTAGLRPAPAFLLAPSNRIYAGAGGNYTRFCLVGLIPIVGEKVLYRRRRFYILGSSIHRDSPCCAEFLLRRILPSTHFWLLYLLVLFHRGHTVRRGRGIGVAGAGGTTFARHYSMGMVDRCCQRRDWLARIDRRDIGFLQGENTCLYLSIEERWEEEDAMSSEAHQGRSS